MSSQRGSRPGSQVGVQPASIAARERDTRIAALKRQGKSAKEIAAELGMKPESVRTRIMLLREEGAFE